MHIKQPSAQLDHLFRQTRMNLVSYSQMADTKAHILLSISSVLLSISLTKVADPRFTGSITALVLFLLITIFLALMTVIPRVQGFHRKKHTVHDPDYTPLFFGNYMDVSYDEYAKDLEEVLNDSDRTYEIMIKELYYAGMYLVKGKYKYIRYSYMFFFVGLIVSTLIFFLQNIF